MALLLVGDLPFVERRYNPATGPGDLTRCLSPDAVQPGAVLSPALVANLELPSLIEKREGLAARPVAEWLQRTGLKRLRRRLLPAAMQPSAAVPPAGLSRRRHDPDGATTARRGPWRHKPGRMKPADHARGTLWQLLLPHQGGGSRDAAPNAGAGTAGAAARSRRCPARRPGQLWPPLVIGGSIKCSTLSADLLGPEPDRERACRDPQCHHAAVRHTRRSLT